MPAALTAFTLRPVLVERPWGGRALEELGKSLPPGDPIGESWEVSDLPSHVAPHVVDPRSRVAEGPFEGRSLSELIESHGSSFLGSAKPTTEGRFPLLVKILDAHQHLSVQVHPHARYVETHPAARLKTESWYVMRAAPAAELFLGVQPGLDVEQVTSTLGSAAFVELLRRVPAAAGDFHHLPAGLVHALGAGVMVAEVQTPSDTTFRIYDWAEEYGREPRALHFEEAMETLVLDPSLGSHLTASTSVGTRDLERNEHYWIREHRTEGGRLEMLTEAEVRILLPVEGNLQIDSLDVPMGATAVVPASAIAQTTISASKGTVLEVGLVG